MGYDLAINTVTDFFYYSSTLLRVSRTIAEHDSVRVVRKDLFCRCKCRIDGYLAASLIQGTGDIALRAEVHESYFWSIALENVLLTAGNFLDYFSSCICF